MQYSIGVVRNLHTYEVTVLITKCVNDQFTDEEILQKASLAISREIIYANRARPSSYWKINEL